MTEDHGTALVHRFFAGTGATYDHIARLCTIGFDRLWKKKIVEKIPQGSYHILDQACGTGILTLKIARRFPECRVVGVDVTKEYLVIAKRKAAQMKINNVDFVLGRAEDVVLDRNFDCVTSSYLAKYVDLGKLIGNLKSMLQDRGVLIMHDFTYPTNRPFTIAWQLYFKLLQTVGAKIYPQWKAAFDGLPDLLRESKWKTRLTVVLTENGFSDIMTESLTCGTSAIVTARKGYCT
jgi:demethylmenaquinone methyltransferase/2-methoxy-6-polyprenyl-1,4-benzoquinol methylase